MSTATRRRNPGRHLAWILALATAAAAVHADDPPEPADAEGLRLLEAPGPALPRAEDAELGADRFVVDPPPALPENLGEHFSVRVQRVHMQQTATFDEDGEVANVSRTLMLNLHGQWDHEAVSPVSFVGPTIHSAVTGVGEQIKPEANAARHRHINRMRHAQGAQQRPSFNAAVQLQYPKRPAWTIDRLEASVEVTFAQGPVRYLVAGPLGEIIDQNVPIEDVDASHIQITRPADNHGRLMVAGDLAPRVVADGIRLVGADGEEMDLRNTGVSHANAMFQVFLRRNLPDDAYLVIPIYDATVDHELSIELRDIPLPSDTPGVL